MRFGSNYGVSSYELSLVWAAGCFYVHDYPVTTSWLFLYWTNVMFLQIAQPGKNLNAECMVWTSV
jgi:hypothetical protein